MALTGRTIGSSGLRLALAVHSLDSVGGTEVNVFQTARELSRRGHQIDLLSPRAGALEAEYRSFCRSVNRTPIFDFARNRGLRDLIRMTPAVWSAVSRRPDVIYANRFSEVVWAAISGTLARAPVVCHLHEIRNRRPGNWPARRIRFIAVSEYLRRAWIDVGLPPERIAVVQNGIDPQFYRPGGMPERSEARAQLGLPEEGFVVLYYGRLDPEKGVEVLLDAWGRLGVAPGEGRLVLLGSASLHHPDPAGYERFLHARAPAGCSWLPPRADVLPFLHAADVVAVPSIWEEPFGRVVIEAMATGRPVVASRTGGIPEILSGSFKDLMVDPGDSAALATALGALMGWRQSKPELAARCADHIRHRFSLEQTVDGIERVLTDAAHGAQ